MLRNLSVCQKEALLLTPIVSGKWGIWLSSGYYHTSLQDPLDPFNMFLWYIARHSGSSGPGNSHPGLLNLLTSPTSSFLFIPPTHTFSLLLTHNPPWWLSVTTLCLLEVAMATSNSPKCLWLFSLYHLRDIHYSFKSTLSLLSPWSGLVWWFHCTLTYSGYVSGSLYRIIP